MKPELPYVVLTRIYAFCCMLGLKKMAQADILAFSEVMTELRNRVYHARVDLNQAYPKGFQATNQTIADRFATTTELIYNVNKLLIAERFAKARGAAAAYTRACDVLFWEMASKRSLLKAKVGGKPAFEAPDPKCLLLQNALWLAELQEMRMWQEDAALEATPVTYALL